MPDVSYVSYTHQIRNTISQFDASLTSEAKEADKSASVASVASAASAIADHITASHPQSDLVEFRKLLAMDLQNMSADGRDEIITALQQEAQKLDDEGIKKLPLGLQLNNALESQLPIVKEEASHGSSIDRLLELLISLHLILGKAIIERSNSAAKLAELSTLQTKAAGEKTINSAEVTLLGAGAGFGMATLMSGIGLRQHAKGTGNLVRNMANKREVDSTRQMNTGLNNAQLRHGGALTGNSPQERLDTLDTPKGKVTIAPNESQLNRLEQNTLQRMPNDNEVTAASQEASYRENEYLFGQQLVAGNAIMAVSQQTALIGQSGFGVQAASATVGAKNIEVNVSVTSSAEHDEERLKQRLEEIANRLMATTNSIAESHNQLNTGIVGNIKG
jgi:hypothetical protein